MQAKKLRELLGAAIDWSFLIAEAAEHSVRPLLERHLRAGAADSVPPEFARKLADASRANTVRCLYLAAELNRVMDEFASNSIHAIPYKGPVLAVQAYADITAREFDDLDIIVRQRDVPKAHEILTHLGYRPRFPWIHSPQARKAMVPGEYNYRDEKRRIMLELHTELTLRHFPVPPGLDEFSRRLVRVDVAGHPTETFSAEDGLTALAIHGAKDFWERIVWVADISELIQAHPRLDWDQAFRSADSVRGGRMLRLALALASDLLDAPLPPEVVRIVRADSVACQVAERLKRHLLARDPQPSRAGERLRFRRQMVQGYFDGWRYAARLALAPAEEDWESLRAPGRWRPFYSALRPLRLLRRFGPSSRPEQHIPS
ncbi:MAG TPA: nucleotidyltransferase family protein [Candidatus Limnocylindrales bacterium]|nr:nucleotidyltransferase family protein [Candidatus Limnocylindrales bacterium]